MWSQPNSLDMWQVVSVGHRCLRVKGAWIPSPGFSSHSSFGALVLSVVLAWTFHLAVLIYLQVCINTFTLLCMMLKTTCEVNIIGLFSMIQTLLPGSNPVKFSVPITTLQDLSVSRVMTLICFPICVYHIHLLIPFTMALWHLVTLWSWWTVPPTTCPHVILYHIVSWFSHATFFYHWDIRKCDRSRSW